MAETKGQIDHLEVTHQVVEVDSAIAEKVSNGSGNFDIAAQLLAQEELEYTPEEARKVLRKIDWRIMPIASLACGLQFVDKSALGAAATYGMRESIGLVGQEYSWCVTMFYFGYLAGAFISGRGLQYFHAGKYIATCYFFWGITLLGCTGAQNYATLLALRFLLGLFESALVPGLLLITTMWYTHVEQPFRLGMWTLLNGVLPVPFLVIYYGLGHVTTGPLEPWRLIFLLVGLLSCVLGVGLWIFLPDAPTTVTWLTEKEKKIALQRIAESQTGIKNSKFKWEQAREALTDYRVWLIALSMLFSQVAGSVTTNFLGIIIKGFGYTALTAQLFTAPNFAVQAVSQIIVSAPPTFLKSFRNVKQPLTAIASVFGLVGVILLYVTPAEDKYQTLRLGSVIIISCSGVNYTVIMSVIGANIGGFTKKQVTTSMAFFMYCIANIVTPQTFLGTESPRYPTGLTFVITFLSAFIVVVMTSWFAMRFENARRDKMALTDPAYATGAENLDTMSGLRDETDIVNKHHRYSG